MIRRIPAGAGAIRTTVRPGDDGDDDEDDDDAEDDDGEKIDPDDVTSRLGYTEEKGDLTTRTRSLKGYRDSDGSLPDLGPPVQVLLKAGDVVFKHSEVGHCGAPHAGSDIRSMLYYRVRHVDWKEMHQEGRLVDDMWCDLSGVRDLSAAQVLRGGCCHPPAMRDCAHVGQVSAGCCDEYVSMSTVGVGDMRHHSCI
jgi:hypothetical protein